MLDPMLVPDVLRTARRYIDDYNWIKLLDDWQRDEQGNSWYLHLSIFINVNTSLFPATSDWYFVVDDDFPDSDVKVFPSVNNSINTTLYHQAKNSRIARNGLWRLGDICIRENTLSTFAQMPYGSEELLIASILRTKQWLKAAASGSLVNNGDKFELPFFSTYGSIHIVYKENRDSFAKWMETRTEIGLVQMMVHEIRDSQYMKPTIFSNSRGSHVLHMDWGSYFTKYNEHLESCFGIWVMLKNIPVIKDWQTPSTFDELFTVVNQNGVSMKNEILNIIKHNETKFRDGNRHPLLIGFPVPEFFGSQNTQIVWEAILLPRLTAMDGRVCNGFRHNERGRLANDEKMIFKSRIQLDWCDCNNWDSSEITQRGSLPSYITEMKVLIIGAGSVGSIVAELLVREGVEDIGIVDDDILQIGNLVRHTLSIDDLSKYKAESLCKHLAEINPNVKTKAITEKIKKNSDNQIFNKYNLIIDCSASPSVLEAVSKINYDKDICIASISLSLGAKYFFLALKKGRYFSFTDFAQTVNAYTENDVDINPNSLPRDGMGCWHPAFPARMDDIVSGAALGVKAIQRFVEKDNRLSVTLVYSKDDNGYDSSYHIEKEL